MKISHFVNTDVDMPKPMLDALTRFEFRCVFSQKTDVTANEVRDFLASEYGIAMAAEFNPDFMLKAQVLQ
jgi:hypothetical protein